MVSLKYKIIGLCILISLLLVPSIAAKHYEEPTNITGFASFFQWNDRVLTGYFGVGILMAIFFASFVLLKGFESRQAFTGCIFLTLMVSIGLRLLGILDNVYVVGSALVCFLIIILVWFTKD